MTHNTIRPGRGILAGCIRASLLRPEVLARLTPVDGTWVKGTLDGVQYHAYRKDGELHLHVSDSEHITHLASGPRPSLDTLDGNVTAYDVPPEWRLSP